MKKILLILMVLVFAVSALAQKEMLTKEETVNYLNKKLQEVDGRSMSWPNAFSRYSNLSFRIKGDNVELKYVETFQNGTTRQTNYEFNPGHISKFETIHGPQSGSAVRSFRVKFISKTGRFSDTSTALKDVDYADFPYFAALTDARVRMQKALLHLRDLAKAEEEPFGN